MKTENLSTLISIIKNFPSTSVLPVLNGIKIKDGTITVTDMAIMVEVNMEAKENGVISKDLFCSAVTSIKDFKLKVDKNGNYTISNASEKLKIAGQPIADYPDAMIKESAKKTVIGKLGSEEIGYLSIASEFVGTDELSPVLNDVHYKDHIVATDAKFMYWEKPANSFSEELRIPRRVCKLMKIIGGEFNIDKHGDNVASCTSGDYVISFLIPEGEYPNWEAVIPKDHKCTVELDTKEFRDIVNKGYTYGSRATRQMIFTIFKDKIEILAEDMVVGNEYRSSIIPVNMTNKWDDVSVSIGINAKLMVQVLKYSDEETTVLKLTDPMKGIVINDEFMIMPINIEKDGS